MSEEIKKEVTEETETKQEETTAVTTTEAKTEEPPKEEPKKGFFKRVTESKAAKVGTAILLLFGAEKLGEKIGEKKAQKEFNENVIDVEEEPIDAEEDSE